jgi:CheY-like chemotaxis protein
MIFFSRSAHAIRRSRTEGCLPRCHHPPGNGNPPALVLLDISMPAGDGFSVAEQIQTLIPTPTPIIFLTASKKPDFREKAKKLGAAGYFEKPYEAEELFGAIQQALA